MSQEKIEDALYSNDEIILVTRTDRSSGLGKAKVITNNFGEDLYSKYAPRRVIQVQYLKNNEMEHIFQDCSRHIRRLPNLGNPATFQNQVPEEMVYDAHPPFQIRDFEIMVNNIRPGQS